MTEQTRRAFQQQQTFDNNISHSFGRLDFQSFAKPSWIKDLKPETAELKLLWYVGNGGELWLEIQNAKQPAKYIIRQPKDTLEVWNIVLSSLDDTSTYQPMCCKCKYEYNPYLKRVNVKISAIGETNILKEIDLSPSCVEALQQIDDGINEALRIYFKE